MKSKMAVIIVVVFLLAFGAGGYYFYTTKNQDNRTERTLPDARITKSNVIVYQDHDYDPLRNVELYSSYSEVVLQGTVDTSKLGNYPIIVYVDGKNIGSFNVEVREYIEKTEDGCRKWVIDVHEAPEVREEGHYENVWVEEVGHWEETVISPAEPEEGHYETVHIEYSAHEEDIYETVVSYWFEYSDGSTSIMEGISAEEAANIARDDSVINYGSTEEQKYIETITVVDSEEHDEDVWVVDKEYVPAVTEDHWVVDTAAHYEQRWIIDVPGHPAIEEQGHWEPVEC